MNNTSFCPNGNGFILVESDVNQSDALPFYNINSVIPQLTLTSSNSQQFLLSSRANKRITTKNNSKGIASNPSTLVPPGQSTGSLTISGTKPQVFEFEDTLESKRPRMSDEFPDDEVEEKSGDPTAPGDLRRGHRWTSYWTQQHTSILIDRLFEARLRHNREHPLNYFHAFSRDTLAPALDDFKNQLSVPVPFNRVQTKLSLLKARLLKGLERRHLTIDDLPKLVPLPGLLSPLDGGVNGASSSKKLEPNAVIMNGISLELVAKLAYALGGPNGPARVGRSSRKTSAPDADEDDSAASPPAQGSAAHSPRSTASHVTPKRERVEPLPDALSLPTQVPQSSAYFSAASAIASSQACSSGSADNLAAAIRECTVWVAQLVGELRRVPSAALRPSCCCQCTGCKCNGTNTTQTPTAASAAQSSSLLAASQAAGAVAASCDNQQRTLLTGQPRNPTMAATLFPLGTATRPGMYQPLQMGQGTLFGTDDQLAVAMMEMAARQAN